MRNRYRLCEDARPQKLPVSVSSKIKNSIIEIYQHNQNNLTALGQWSEYIEGLISYISNPVIAFDYTNRYVHFPNGAIHLVEMNYDVSFITKSNNANAYIYVYIFDINFKLRDFGLKDPKITENKRYNIMNNTKKKIRLTEFDLHRIVKQVLKEGFGDNETIDMHRANTKRFKREFDKMDRESNGEPTPQMDSAAWEFYNRPNAAQDFEHFPRRSGVRDHNYDSLTLIPIEKRLEDYKRKKHYKYDDISEPITVSDLIKPLSDIDESIRRAIRKVLC